MAKKFTCICIDDDWIYNEIMEKYISEIDFLELVGTYDRPIDGVVAIDKHKPDLIFLDVEMPQINAFDTIEALEELPVIVVLSSHWEHEEKLLAMGVKKFVMKPIKNVDHLAAIAREVLKIEK
ncbi:MAG: response regulator [Reichenbachiella sp.]